jgi:hypothetical protein
MLSRALALLALLILPAHAQTQEQLAAIEHATAAGAEILEHDNAAWLATDAMRADIADPGGYGVRGWVTERSGGDIVVTFVRDSGAALSVAYRSVYRNGTLAETGRADAPLTPEQRALYEARRLAAEHDEIHLCTDRINTVVLPLGDGEIDVYIMPGVTQHGLVPFGGFNRVRVSSGEVRSVHRFTNSCLSLTLESGAAGLFVSQIIGDTPTEVHVFTSLRFNIAVGVATRSGTWMVQGTRITLLSQAGQ